MGNTFKKVEVLVATMYQSYYTLLDKMNIQTDAVVINQCNQTSFFEFKYKDHIIKWINTCQRGLSKSRNMALSYATGDICLIADEDINYVNGYETMVQKSFNCQSKADIIAFNINKLNSEDRDNRAPNENRKAPFYRYYGSVRLAFRRNSIVKNGLHFNELIGAGTKYGSGEDSLFLRESRKKGLKIYENSHCLSTVDYANSSWFTGYDESYYFGKGVFLAAAYGRLAKLYMFYFVLKKHGSLTRKSIRKNILRGIKEYKRI